MSRWGRGENGSRVGWPVGHLALGLARLPQPHSGIRGAEAGDTEASVYVPPKRKRDTRARPTEGDGDRVAGECVGIKGKEMLPGGKKSPLSSGRKSKTPSSREEAGSH